MHAVSSNISYTARNETHERVVRYLCELPADRGVDLSAYDNYAIRSAAVNGHVNVYLCELPADRGVRPGAHDNSAIRWAVQYGHVNVVRYLCELPGDRGVDPAAHISDAMYCHLTTAQPPGLPTPSTNSSYCLRGGSERLGIPEWPIPTPPRPHESQSISAGAARAGACVSRWYHRRLRHEPHQAAGSDSLR